MCDASKDDLVEHAEQEEKERRQKEKQEAHLYVVIKVACDTDFSRQIGDTHYFDLVNFEDIKSYRIHKKTTFEEFKGMVQTDFGVPSDLQRYWVWSQRQNGTIRPNSPLTDRREIDTVLDLQRFKDKQYAPLEKHALMTIKLYLEKPDASYGMLKELEPNDLLLFCKLYDPFKTKLCYVGHIFVDKSMPFKEIFWRLKALAGLEDSTDIAAYEEVRFEPSVMCNELDADASPERTQFLQGDIICIQLRVTPEARSRELRHPTVKTFLEYVQNSKTVNFRPLYNPKKDDGFKLELLKTMSYDEVTTELAKHLDVDNPYRIRLTQHNVSAHMPHRSPIKFQGMDSLDVMILHSRQYTNILYYEILDMPLPYLEKLKCMKVNFYNDKAELEGEHRIWLPKDNTVEDLIGALKEKLGEDYEGKAFRLIEGIQCWHQRSSRWICDPQATLETLREGYWTFRAEVVPLPDRHGNLFIHVCHFRSDENSVSVMTFGDPFWLKIRATDTVADIKPQVKAKLDVSDEEFAKWKFAYHPRQMQSIEYLVDEDIVLEKFARVPSYSESDDTKYYGDSGAFLGLEHEDSKPVKRSVPSRYGVYERGIRIYSN
ncbi:hypothetical protein BSKO_11179 [Bryopsis sp. KO-2023]|nr:hypothetical protein BSKO_11179 [Bryopsis sp. KO-2023]